MEMFIYELYSGVNKNKCIENFTEKVASENKSFIFWEHSLNMDISVAVAYRTSKF